MDKFDFINRIISLYPHAIKDHDGQYDAYKKALPISEKINYDEVFEIYCREFKDSFPPPPGLICEWAQRCRKEEYKPVSKWVNVKIYNPIYKAEVNTDSFPAGTSEEKILSFYKKRFGGDGWQIIEVKNGV